MGIKDIKIRKTTYKFDIGRNYSYKRKYTSIEKSVLDHLKDAFKRKKTQIVKPKSKNVPKKTKKGIPVYWLIALFGVLILAGLVGWVLLTVNSIPINPGEEEVFGPAVIKTKVLESGIVTYQETIKKTYTGYITLEHELSGMENISMELSVYDVQPPYQIYILPEPRDKTQTDTYIDFKKELRNLLNKKGMNVNEIDIQQLYTIPSGSLVIVPAGKLPESMTKNNGANIKKLLERGVSILYIGQSFEELITDQGNIIKTPNDVFNQIGLNFEKRNLPSSDKINIFQPQYIATSVNEGYDSSVIFESISVIKNVEGGYLIILPQTLDAGWRKNAVVAAEDISFLVLETPWIPVVSYKEIQLENTNGTEVNNYFTAPFEGRENYLKIEIKGTDYEKQVKASTLFLKLRADAKGDLIITGGTSLLPYSISGDKTRIVAKLKENETGSEYLFLKILKDGKEYLYKSIFNKKINIQTEVPFDEKIDVEEGEYIVKILDEKGYSYAEGYMNIAPLEIELVALKDNVFGFSFKVGGKKISLQNIIIKVDGGKLGTYEFENTNNVFVDLKTALGEDELETGKHTFGFTVGSLTEEFDYLVAKSDIIFLRIEFIAVGVIAIIIVFGGTYMASKKAPEYHIDIPDFPPAEYIRIPIKKDYLLKIFEKENLYHKWKYTPLRLQEIKNGLRKEYHGGRHLNVTDYNLIYILDKLKGKGEVKEYLEYYSLSAWEKMSGKSVKFLSMFRKIRDICIINAIPFTNMGKTNDCNTEINVIGQRMFVHIYTREGIKELIRNVIKKTKSGINIILFQKEARKNEFREMLFSPSTAAAILKMEMEGRGVLLLTISELEKMVKEMKS